MSHAVQLSDSFLRDLIVNPDTFQPEILVVSSKVDKQKTDWTGFSKQEKEDQLNGSYLKIVFEHGQAIFFIPNDKGGIISSRLSKYLRDNTFSQAGINATFDLFNRYGVKISTEYENISVNEVHITQPDINRIGRKISVKQST